MPYLARITRDQNRAGGALFKVYAGDPDLAPLLFCSAFASEREAITYAARIAGEYETLDEENQP